MKTHMMFSLAIIMMCSAWVGYEFRNTVISWERNKKIKIMIKIMEGCEKR